MKIKIPSGDLPTINLKVLIVLTIVGILVITTFFPQYLPDSKKKVVNQSVNISNITQSYIEIINDTPTVTETPDTTIYYKSEFQNGTRKLGRPFTFFRQNVTGYQDIKVTTRVYDYKIFPYINWFNPSDYKYYLQYPTSSNNEFIFVFVNVYMDDIGGQDTRFWLPNSDTIVLQIGNNIYAPLGVEKQIRYQQLEESFSYNKNPRDRLKKVKYYGQHVEYSSSLEYASTAGEYSVSDPVLKGGESNAQDGYLLYEIPKNTVESDIYVSINYASLGYASWRLGDLD